MMFFSFSLIFFIFSLCACAFKAHAVAAGDSLDAPQRVEQLKRQTVDRARYLVKRKQFSWRGVPYGFTGIPLVFFNPNRNWNLGGRIHLADYSRRAPYRYKLKLQWNRPFEGKAGYLARFTMPRFRDTDWGLDLQAGFNFGFGRYYGVGNEQPYVAEFVDSDSPAFKSRYYYHYILERPRITVGLSRQIRHPISVAVALGGKWSRLRRRDRESLLFDEQSQVGRERKNGMLGVRLTWDTRDDEIVPRRGVLHEWSYETSRGALLGFLFDELDLDRFTFIDARFFSLSERMVLGNRLVFEVLSGSEKPVDELGEIGNSRIRFKGLGGISTLRGFDSQRFVDDVRFLGNTEMRYWIASGQWFGQYLEWHGVAFIDMGRVWSDLGSVEIKGVHASGGAGLRLIWDSDFVIRLESGFSSERSFWGLQLRNTF